MKTLYRLLFRSALPQRQKQYLFLTVSSAIGLFTGAVIFLAVWLCGRGNAGVAVSCILLPFTAMFINAGLYLCRHDFSDHFSEEGRTDTGHKGRSQIISA